MLIPWYIAPMREGNDGHRTLGVYVDRVIGSTGERAAWPAVSYVQSRFLSDFEPLEVPVYSQSLLAVTPYVSGLYDNVGGGSDFEGGADIFWKPRGQFQLTATLNPDFGQVESRSEEHTSELQSLMRISYAVFCLKKKKTNNTTTD